MVEEIVQISLTQAGQGNVAFAAESQRAALAFLGGETGADHAATGLCLVLLPWDIRVGVFGNLEAGDRDERLC